MFILLSLAVLILSIGLQTAYFKKLQLLVGDVYKRCSHDDWLQIVAKDHGECQESVHCRI